jgi:hypothetical protein
MLLVALSANAQDGIRDRIKAQKVAYITEQLDLTVDEAQKFWPIYNRYETTIHRLRKIEMRRLKEDVEMKERESITDAEAEVFLDRLLKIEKEQYEAQTALIKDLRKVLSAKRIIKLKRVEENFNKAMISKFREQRYRKKPGN